MKIRVGLLALALAGAGLARAPAIAETPKPAIASAAALDSYFAGVETTPVATPLGGEADYRAFAQALGQRASLAFGSFAAEGAGVVARDVVVTFGGAPDAGLKLAELRLYRGSMAAAKGEIAAERLDVKGLTVFGLEKLMEQSTNAYTKAIVSGIEGATDQKIDDATKAELGAGALFEKYDFSMDRLLIDGFILHAPDPQLAAKDAAAGDEFRGLLRTYAAMGRAMSARAFIMRGAKAELAYTAGAAKSSMTFAMPFLAERGVARGDIDAIIMNDLSFTLDSMTAATDAAPAVPVSMGGGVERYTVTGLKLARLLDYWARGEAPSPKVVDLLSLGLWETKNERYTLGGAPFYSLDHARTDLTKFRWFLPTSVRMSFTNLSYDIGALMKFGQSAAPQSGEGAADLKSMISLFDKHGFSKIAASGDTVYDWSPETGAATFVTKNDLKTMGQLDIDLGLGLPTFKQFASLHPKKGEAFDSARLSALFADGALSKASTTIADRGVLTRAFALAADMQAAQAGAPAGSIKGAELRTAAAFSMRSLGSAPTPLAPVYTAFADFIADGGTLSLSASPKAPIPFALIMAPGPEGEDPLTRLNLSARRAPN